MAKSNRPSFAVITPTIGRSTLQRTIESVYSQDYPLLEHIVIADGIDLKDMPDYVQVYKTPKTNNYGNAQRHAGWEYTKADYICYLDDDDFYCNDQLFTQLADYIETRSMAELIIFPAIRLGDLFFNVPPGLFRTVSCQYIHKRKDINGSPIRWPNNSVGDQDYHHDGVFLNSIVDKYGYWLCCIKPSVQIDYISRGQMI